MNRWSRRERTMRRRLPALALCCVIAAAFGISAAVPKEEHSSLDDLAFSSHALTAGARHVPVDTLRAEGSYRSVKAVDAFVHRSGGAWRAIVDRHSGSVSLIEGSGIPWIPGRGNGLTWAEAGVSTRSLDGIPRAAVIDRAMDLIRSHPDLFGARAEELVLMDGASGPVGDYLYFLDFRWTRSGIPVEGAHVVFRLNHGNLVQIGQERISGAIASLSTEPSFSLPTAWDILRDYVVWRGDEEAVSEPRLVILPALTPEAMAGRPLQPGEGLAYHLAYMLTFRRPGVQGTWQAKIDAHTGEILSFTDVNRYGHVHGGVYATDGLIREQDKPFAHADIGGESYADSAGRFDGYQALSTMTGRYARIHDECGDISLETETGDLDFNKSPDTNCATPGFGGAGNTRAARTQFYHVNALRSRALGYLSDNGWLNRSLLANVNINSVCNAFWSGSSINFYRQGGGCGNTGELPGISHHEWGHGLDANDGNGDSPELGTAETYADFTAAVMSHASCVGRGFLGNNCGGYGNPCTDCTGVRDIDYSKRESPTPATTRNFTMFLCPETDYYFGPCGKEGHCESYVSSQAMWDLAARDLVDWGLDLATSWQLVEKLWFYTRSTAGGAFSCDASFHSDGCGPSSLFSVLRVADDCDGDLSNGTPHASAIYYAMQRHEIACAGVVNSDQACCPSMAATPLTAQLEGTDVSLGWTDVGGASRYLILRNDIDCGSGFTKIAEVDAPASSFSDADLAWGQTYHYRVQPIGESEACAGPVSPCATLSLPAIPPGLHIQTRAYTDACASGGAGDQNGIIDPAEEISLDLQVQNTLQTVSNVRADVLSASDGVTFLVDSATFPDIPEGGSAASEAPFRFTLDPAFDCLDEIVIVIGFTADQGTWQDAFTLQVGEHFPGEEGVAIEQSFSAWPSPGWTVENTGGDCVWESNTTTGRSNTTGGSGRTATADSDYCGDGTMMHTSLVSPAFDLSDPRFTVAELRYYSSFEDYGGTTRGHVEISTDGGSAWQTLETLTPENNRETGLRVLDLSAFIGHAGLLLRFRFVADDWEMFWQVDDLEVVTVIHPYCIVNGCDTGMPLSLEASGTPGEAEAPAAISFAAHPDGGIPPYSYAWDFGDGTASSERNPLKTYADPGTFDWTLVVTDAAASAANAAGTISVLEPCTWTCSASASPTAGDAPLDTQFMGSATSDACGLTASYNWTFGDGQTSTDQNPLHRYDTPGDYGWSLAVVADGENCTRSGVVTVTEPCSMTCAAYVNPTLGKAPLPVTFEAQVDTSSCDGSPVYSWDLGDGAVSSEPSFDHLYNASGEYAWSLTVTIEDQTCTASGTLVVETAVPGDCDGDGFVSIGEVQGAVNMFLGLVTPDCGVDGDGDGAVSVAELQLAINAFLARASHSLPSRGA